MPVATVVRMLADGMTDAEILEAYPDLEAGGSRRGVALPGRSGARARVAACRGRLKFLIDNALSPLVAVRLTAAGHDAAHVRDYGWQAAEVAVVFDRAAAEERVLVSADTDFGTLLAGGRAPSPSVVLLRRGPQRRPVEQVALLLGNLETLTAELQAGSVAVIEPDRDPHPEAASAALDGLRPQSRAISRSSIHSPTTKAQAHVTHWVSA